MSNIIKYSFLRLTIKESKTEKSTCSKISLWRSFSLSRVSCEEHNWFFHTPIPRLWGYAWVSHVRMTYWNRAAAPTLVPVTQTLICGSCVRLPHSKVMSQLIRQISEGSLFNTILEMEKTNKWNPATQHFIVIPSALYSLSDGSFCKQN